jgi:hypothetical protein
MFFEIYDSLYVTSESLRLFFVIIVFFHFPVLVMPVRVSLLILLPSFKTSSIPPPSRTTALYRSHRQSVFLGLLQVAVHCLVYFSMPSIMSAELSCPLIIPSCIWPLSVNLYSVSGPKKESRLSRSLQFRVNVVSILSFWLRKRNA